MRNLEMRFTKLISKIFTSKYISKKRTSTKMQEIRDIMKRQCIMFEGKIYRQQKNGVICSEPVGWYNTARSIGYINNKAWKTILTDDGRTARISSKWRKCLTSEGNMPFPKDFPNDDTRIVYCCDNCKTEVIQPTDICPGCNSTMTAVEEY